MALKQHTKDRLRFGLGSYAAATNYATVINAGTGTIYQAAKDALANAVGNRDVAKGLDTKFAANTAFSGNDTWRMAVATGSYAAALDIKTEQAT